MGLMGVMGGWRWCGEEGKGVVGSRRDLRLGGGSLGLWGGGWWVVG